jgi:thioesterase domain-containing protein/acyl carrier protein
MIGGDSTQAEVARRWAAGRKLLNLYGPTEFAIYGTGHEYDPACLSAPPIGRPVANVRVHVLQGSMNPAPIGVAGELYLAGVGLARGYLHRPGLTAERFVPDPFSDVPGARMYRTGDLGRWNEKGELEFLGRLDQQVKIRGFRIELGEIEAALSAHPSVRGAVVVAREDAPGDKRLVAYVAAGGGECTATALEEHLRAILPEYMVPVSFVRMEALPLCPNGKVDRKALPAPEGTRAGAAASAMAPRTPTEQALVAIWEELLGVSPVGVTCDFFALGGHSLLAVSLMARIEQRLGRKLRLSALFRAPTVASLARLIREPTAPEAWSPLVAIQPSGRGRPFFCVHPLVGTTMVFVHLARHLGVDRPFYGLEGQGLLDELAPLASIEAMAARYIAAIRTVEPEGPYLLGGWSLGGVVAIEMARQLRERGQDIALLVVLDTGSPDLVESVMARDGLSALVEIATQLGVDLSLDELHALSKEQQVEDVYARLVARGVLPPEIAKGRLVAHIEAHLQASAQHLPRVPCPMTIFRATELTASAGHDGPGPDIVRGWRAHSSHPVEHHDVPGTHMTMVFEPHVRVLSERLRACLLEADPLEAPLDRGRERSQ